MYKFNNIFLKIFILLFFIILLVPLSHISKEKKSIIENRYLADYKNFFDYTNSSINLDYGKDFENWLKDRFRGRIKLIHVYHCIKYYLSGRFVRYNSTFFDKKLKFVYKIGYRPYFPNEINKIYKQFDLLNKYCQKYNIKLYILIFPRKETMYPPLIFKFNDIDFLQKQIFEMNVNKDLNIVFPLDEFIKQKDLSNYLLFHKTDHHTTMDGTFIAYNELMKAIQKDFHNIKIAKYSDFNYSFSNKVCTEREREYNSGLTCQQVLPDFICNKYLDIIYRYYHHKNFKDLKKNVIDTGTINLKTFYYPSGSDFKVLIFGDSSTENLSEIIPYSFKQTNIIRLNGPIGIPEKKQFKILKYYKKDIQNFKPDIIVLCIGYSSLSYFLKIDNIN